jgi:hypothetical protein
MRAASTQPPWQISRGTDTFLCSFDVRSTKACHKCLQKPPEGFFKGKNRKRKQQQQQAAEEAAEGDEEAEDEEAEEAAEEAAGGANRFWCGFGARPKKVNRKAPSNYHNRLQRLLHSKAVRATAAAQTSNTQRA